ncbi:MAG: hypothetical protein CMJ41_01205 [Phycisphaerae bacterium]|nr:hypothetical protein [Phycisphaerae bacterium]
MITVVLLILLHVASPTTPTASNPDAVESSREQGDAIDYETLVAQLDSADWQEREAATMQLARANVEVPVGRIEVSLQEGGLSLEQVMRLLRVMEIRLLHVARGAIGIQMPLNQAGVPGDLVRTAGVRVSAVIPGLPAEKILQPGDLITQIDDQPISDREDLARIVQRHWPGDVLRFRIVRTTTLPREGEDDRSRTDYLDVEIVLGSTDDLRRSGGSQSVLDPALADRRQRFMALYQKYGAVPSTIPAPMNPEQMEIQSEADPMIRGMLQQLEAAREGRYTMTLVELRAQLIEKLASLDATLLEGELPLEQRRMLERRRARMQELIDSVDPQRRW